MNKKKLLKEKIGQVAMKCFSKYGLDKTTLDDIAKEIGLNKTPLGQTCSSPIAMNDALKLQAEHKAILKNQDEIDYSQILKESKFLLALIFEGLNRKSVNI